MKNIKVEKAWAEYQCLVITVNHILLHQQSFKVWSICKYDHGNKQGHTTFQNIWPIT